MDGVGQLGYGWVCTLMGASLRETGPAVGLPPPPSPRSPNPIITTIIFTVFAPVLHNVVPGDPFTWGHRSHCCPPKQRRSPAHTALRGGFGESLCGLDRNDCSSCSAPGLRLPAVGRDRTEPALRSAQREAWSGRTDRRARSASEGLLVCAVCHNPGRKAAPLVDNGKFLRLLTFVQ